MEVSLPGNVSLTRLSISTEISGSALVRLYPILLNTKPQFKASRSFVTSANCS